MFIYSKELWIDFLMVVGLKEMSYMKHTEQKNFLKQTYF